MSPGETIEKLFAGLNRRDVSVMDEVFHDDALMDWPQFSERVCGATPAPPAEWRAEWVERLE